MDSRSHSIPPEWVELFKLIPGYDPIATAGECWFDYEVADTVIRFSAEMLTHIEGEKAGTPLVLEPWQKAHVGCAFGWKRQDGTRRYREVFDYEPRKQGKTTKLGGLINFVAFCDGEAGAQIYSAASEREQAALVYRQTKGQIVGNKELSDNVRIFSSFKSIEYPNGVTYKALSAESETKHGFNSHFVVVDELHAQPDRDLVDVLVTSTGSRRQPLVWYITTADFMRESICNEKYDYACKVRDGLVNDPYFLPIIYESLPEDDWRQEATWRKANPNLGVSVSLEYLQRECKRAQEIPSYENTFRRLHLNQRTEQDIRWITQDLWASGNERFDAEILEGLECWAGLDFGWRDDFAALVLVFPVDELFYVLPWFWLPKDGPRDKRRPPINDFVQAGLVKLTDGNATDIEAIYEVLRECRRKYFLQTIAFDPNNARKQSQDLMSEGFEVVEFYQSKRNYNEPCRFMEALLKEGKLRHGGHRVLSWMASNVAAEMDGLGQIMPKKKKSAEKIDGICALCMALGRAALRPPPSVYDSRGIMII